MVLGLKECLVECATLCVKSEVILNVVQQPSERLSVKLLYVLQRRLLCAQILCPNLFLLQICVEFAKILGWDFFPTAKPSFVEFSMSAMKCSKFTFIVLLDCLKCHKHVMRKKFHTISFHLLRLNIY